MAVSLTVPLIPSLYPEVVGFQPQASDSLDLDIPVCMCVCVYVYYMGGGGGGTQVLF